MDNLTEIKKELDLIYKEYKNKKSQLNGAKTTFAANLIIDMTLNNNVNYSDVAAELARFSADVVNVYFDSLTKSVTVPIDVIDKILKELYLTDKNVRNSQYYVSKYVSATTCIMKYYNENALKSAQLPIFVAFIARFAVQSGSARGKFQKLVNNTSGGIYMLEYDAVNPNSLKNIWNATKSVFPDFSKAKYESFIIEWGKKYGFIQAKIDTVPAVSAQACIPSENIVSKYVSDETSNSKQTQVPLNEINADSLPGSITNVPTSDTDNSCVNNTPDTPNEALGTSEEKFPKESNEIDNAITTLSDVSDGDYSCETLTQELYNSLKKDLTKERESIITAFTELVTPIGKAIDTINGEINKSREIAAENVALRSRITDLERQLSEQRAKLQTVNQSLLSVKEENGELKNQIPILERKIVELDSKLNDAYSINSRESSLEAEKIRSELKKAFAFLYEDWLEYEFSDVSEENYESLQAIIKKIFRSLERSGIDFKGNN